MVHRSTVAATNNGITHTVVSNGTKTNELLYIEFEEIGRDEKGVLSKETEMVDAAITKYVRSEYKNDGRKK